MRKKVPNILLVFILFSSYTFSQVPVEIQDPWITGIDKLPPRIAIWPSPDAESAEQDSYENAAWVRSLNGSY